MCGLECSCVGYKQMPSILFSNRSFSMSVILRYESKSFCTKFDIRSFNNVISESLSLVLKLYLFMLRNIEKMNSFLT